MNDLENTKKEQKLSRIKEIDKEISKLKEEKSWHEKYLYDLKQGKVADQHKETEGKYFKLVLPFNRREKDYITALKVVKVLDMPNADYAECITIIDGKRSGSWIEKGIQKMVLGLWVNDKLMLMGSDKSPKFIDFYTETSEEDFNKIKEEILEELK